MMVRRRAATAAFGVVAVLALAACSSGEGEPEGSGSAGGGELGEFDEGSIEWVETVSANREPFIQEGTVDLVVATYTINDDRKELVSFAGPYDNAGQALLVMSDTTDITGPDDLAGDVAESDGEFMVVGEPFTEEPYGIGLAREDTEFRMWINDVLEEIFEDGRWLEAWNATAGTVLPDPQVPTLDRYEIE